MPDPLKIPLSLYIHMPWCVQKCPYCDFNSHRAVEIDEQAYIAALLMDLQKELPDTAGREIQTIFIGGGTPSLFSAASLQKLFAGINALVNVAQSAEITLEANPGSADEQNFVGYQQAGINRLSIGIQSFSNSQLKLLGRIHDCEEAFSAVEKARMAGFENINLDLMYGLPGQTIAMMQDDLEQALALQPEHLSWYQLTLEPNTPFHHSPPADIPHSDLLADMSQVGITFLQQHGYQQYEVSAYATAQRYCQHNLNYWQFGDYLGIGAGAHGKLTMADGTIRRRRKQRQPQGYLKAVSQGDSYSSESILKEKDLILEFMMNTLRLHRGFSRELFEQSTGLSYRAIAAKMEILIASGLLAKSDGQIFPTKIGRQYLNELLLQFA